MNYNLLTKQIIENIKKVVEGKDDVIEKVLICFLAKGHLLIEDVPGVGKTTLVKTLSKSLDLSYKRIQFTPDLMPSDITGMTVLNRENNEFIFKKGPIFNQIILADEINRTSPKTQASLLQAMEEGIVSIENITYKLKKPFMVLATQNPVGYQGTFPLPEAQLDRFLMSISIGYPDENSEKNIIMNYKLKKSLEEVVAIASEEDLIKMQEEVDKVEAKDSMVQFIVNILNGTRKHKDILLGASPRAGIDLFKGSKAVAFLRGRNYIIPDDVKEILPFVLKHRIILSSEARIDGRKIEEVLKDVLRHLYVPVVNEIES